MLRTKTKAKQEKLAKFLDFTRFLLDFFLEMCYYFSVNITLKGGPHVLQFYGADSQSTGENHPDEKMKSHIHSVRNRSHVLPGKEIHDPCAGQHRKT